MKAHAHRHVTDSEAHVEFWTMDSGPQPSPRLEAMVNERRRRDLVAEAELRRQRRGRPGVIRRLLRRARNAIERRS